MSPSPEGTDYLASKSPCMSCPMCGSEVPVEPHTKNTRWSYRQDWWLMRMRGAGASWKMISGAFGGLSRDAVEHRIALLRGRGM